MTGETLESGESIFLRNKGTLIEPDFGTSYNQEP
jgi:hypothetical protein